MNSTFFNLVQHHAPYRALAETLPGEIAAVLIPLATALHSVGFDAIQAKLKLDKLSSMSQDEICAAFQAYMNAAK